MSYRTHEAIQTLINNDPKFAEQIKKGIEMFDGKCTFVIIATFDNGETTFKIQSATAITHAISIKEEHDLENRIDEFAEEKQALQALANKINQAIDC